MDVTKMPLGRLSRSQLARGFGALTEIQDILQNQAAPSLLAVPSCVHTRRGQGGGLRSRSLARSLAPPISAPAPPPCLSVSVTV